MNHKLFEGNICHSYRRGALSLLHIHLVVAYALCCHTIAQVSYECADAFLPQLPEPLACNIMNPRAGNLHAIRQPLCACGVNIDAI